jgi:hypothetical protein
MYATAASLPRYVARLAAGALAELLGCLREKLVGWLRATGLITSCPSPLLERLLEELPEVLAADNHCPWGPTTCSSAAFEGHLEVLQWARKHGCPWDSESCAYAAKGGHLHVLQWAREHDCPWNKQTCRQAAEHGHLDVLQWAREQDPPCPWNEANVFLGR